MDNLLTIIIPCYNEEKYIYNILQCIANQKGINGTQVLIADANSTDNTLKVIELAQKKFIHLKIKVIKGGLVAYGRNKGGTQAKTDYLLFMDADTTLLENNIIENTLKNRFKYDIISAKHVSTSKDLRSKLVFKIFNFIRWIMLETFCTGVYFFISKSKFYQLGMFDETVTNSEDYFLSRKIPKSKFLVLKNKVGQDNRRFKKMGYLKFLKILILNYWHRDNINYFRKDIGYWKPYED
mgnify:FL=1|tara:strand:+ start:756 stop:1469 length:714 start_codon:yes stop_codon:yes gene_type:complete